MPRVHGIDIAPRRGRGPHRQRIPMVADGVDVGFDVLAAMESKAGASSRQHDNSDYIHDNVRTSLDVAVHGSAGHGGEENYCIASPEKSPLGSNISGKENDETMPAVTGVADTTSNINVVSSASTKGMITATSCIRPQPRESLDSIMFGSHSFSVQQLSHKSLPTCNFNNERLNSLCPSLESTTKQNNISARTEMSTEVKSDVASDAKPIEDMGKINMAEEALNPIHPLSEVSPIFEGITFTDATVSLNQNETTEEAQRNTNQCMAPMITDESQIDAGDSLNEANNTHWLIHRCSAACLQMETQMSPLELAIQTLHALRCTANDDRFEENLQHTLFAVLKNGKKRDLEFVFEVSERARDLRNDTTLTDASLQQAVSTRNDVANEDHYNKSDDDKIDAHLDVATQSIERLPVRLEQNEGLSTANLTPSGQSHTNDMHLSRRKKRQPSANGVILQGENTSFASIREKAFSRESTDADKEQLQECFKTNEDGLDMQDDEMWSFLPNTQLIDEMEENEEPPIQRITRSMILENNVATENTEPCLGFPMQLNGAAGTHDKCAEEDVAEDLETKVLDLDAKVSEVRIDSSNKDHVEWEQSGTSKILMQSEKTRVDHMASPNEDGEVYSMVKIRERSEGKGSVRIIFTCLTPTHRHMQMIETIGAEYVNSIEEAHTATHVIASDGTTKLRRTPKLMICICRVAQILSIEWLEQSAKQQCVLDTNDFLLLDDREAEKRYNFSMKTTLRNGILARKRRGGVLGGWSVYICSGVAGNKAPSLREIHLIIEAGGGQVMKSLSRTESFDRTKIIVLTSDPSTKLQLGELGVAKAKRCGAKVMSTSSLFHTIITQNLLDIDINDDAVDETMDLAPSGVDDILMCASPASMASSISVQSNTPVKRDRLRANTPSRVTTIDFNDNESVSTRGCRVSHLEHAMHVAIPYSKKRKPNYKEYEQSTFELCTNSITRHSYQSVLTSIEALSTGRDQAANLWREYFSEASKTSLPAATKTLSIRPRKGVRCLRGRNRSISPLVSCTNSESSTEPINTKTSVFHKSVCNQLLEDNVFSTWESYVLFTLGDRAKAFMLNFPETLDEIIPASTFFPHPIAIVQDGCTKHVKELDSAQTISPHHGLSLVLAAHGFDTERSSFKIFGTLQDLFLLHRQHQTSGMIPEQAVAMLSLQAIEAVAAMHSCRVVHNEIGLDSFLVVKQVKAFPHNRVQSKCENVIDSWYLQLIGFGHNAVVLNCRENCQEEHFARDYQCLANVIHLLLTGGVEITLTSVNGKTDFTSKPFIKGNMFLRGALSWCSLFQALMCADERAPTCKTSDFFQIRYPVNFPYITTSNNERMNRFGWSCRVLQELCDRRVLNDFIDGLCTYNSRFNHPSTDVSKYGIGSGIVRQSFTCYTSSEQTADHLMELESRLHSDHSALAQREKKIKEEIAKFEKLKLEQRAVLRRESDVQIREKDLLQREREHALEIKELDALKQKIRLMERRIEQKLELLGSSSSTLSSRFINQQESTDVDTTRIGEPHSKLSFKSQLHAPQKSATKCIIDQPMRSLSGHLHKNRIYFTKEETFISPHTSQHKPKMVHNHQPPSVHSSNDAIGVSQEDFHDERPYSQESTSSSRQKKKGSSRKSPKCSLHFLPRSPQKTPKKVFIDLGEE